MIRREITQADYDTAILACARAGERPTIGAVRARLKRAGFSDRDLRVQGFDLDAVRAQARSDAAREIVEAAAAEVIEAADLSRIEVDAVHERALGRARALVVALVVFMLAWIGVAAWLAR